MSSQQSNPGDEGFTVVAKGTWTYGENVPTEIKLLSRPAADASSRYVEHDESGEFVLDESMPVPETKDGLVYYIGATQGGEFQSVEEAIAWADSQTWGPVKWIGLKR